MHATGSMNAYQIVEHTSVQSPLLASTLPHLLVVMFQAVPVATELLEAGLVDVF